MGTVFGLSIERVKKVRRKEEATTQERLWAALQWLLPRDVFVFACPNGGSRHIREAVNLKKQGVRAGVPDLIFIHAGKAFGLEMKSAKGVLGDSQKAVFPLLREAGMRIEVARSYDEAISLIKEMGIPIKTNENPFAVKDVFRDATRRRA